MLTADGKPREDLWVEDRIHPNQGLPAAGEDHEAAIWESRSQLLEGQKPAAGQGREYAEAAEYAEYSGTHPQNSAVRVIRNKSQCDRVIAAIDSCEPRAPDARCTYS